MGFQVTSEPLPSGWLDEDVGSVVYGVVTGGTGVGILSGTGTYANGTFTVKGAGLQINGTADTFNFAYQQLSGDGSIVARVVSVSSGATAGVMLRETLDTAASNANTVEWAPGGSEAPQALPTTATAMPPARQPPRFSLGQEMSTELLDKLSRWCLIRSITRLASGHRVEQTHR